MLETSNFVHVSAMRSLSPVFPMWVWSGSHEQFLHCGLRKFRHSKSSVYSWYTQLDCRQFVYKTMKATRTRHGWVHMFTTHRPSLTLQLHNFDLFRACRTALLRGNWQDFNWHDASRGPFLFNTWCSNLSSIISLIASVGLLLLSQKAYTIYPRGKNKLVINFCSQNNAVEFYF